MPRSKNNRLTTMIQSNEDRIAAAYADHHESIMLQLKELNVEINRHQQETRGRARNWAHVGDLAHVNQLLTELLSFLKGGQ